MPYVRPIRCSLHTPVLIATALRLALADAPAAAQAGGSRGTRPPTAADAAAFMARAESVLTDLAVKAERADWVANTYITFDTEELTAQANLVLAHFHVRNYGRVCELAPLVLQRAPHLQEMRTTWQEARRRMQ